MSGEMYLKNELQHRAIDTYYMFDKISAKFLIICNYFLDRLYLLYYNQIIGKRYQNVLT